MKEEIKFDDFSKLEIRVGEIKSAEKVEGADRLMKLEIDFGEQGARTLVSGIAEYYSSEEVVGRRVPVLVNLAGRTLRGVESQGMVLFGIDESSGEHKPVFLSPDEELPNGSLVS